jgi:hypothetical protein
LYPGPALTASLTYKYQGQPRRLRPFRIFYFLSVAQVSAQGRSAYAQTLLPPTAKQPQIPSAIIDSTKMATIDPNAWYHLSETRVDAVGKPLANTLQLVGKDMRFGSNTTQAWQFQPVDGIVGRYLMRLSAAGIGQQLSTCFRPDEVHPGKTGVCMNGTSGDNGQKWDIQPWGDGTFKMLNVANGTGYVLDVHPGNPPFMSSEIESNAAEVKQPAQHWLLSSLRPVNDGAYSTIYTVRSMRISLVIVYANRAVGNCLTDEPT